MVSGIERTENMVSNMCRNMAKGQEGNDGTNLSVSKTRTLFITE